MIGKNRLRLKRILLIISITLIVLFLSVLICFTIIYHKYDLDVDKLTSVNNGVKVYSYTGTDSTLYNTDRSIVEIETLPEYVKNAFIATEDKRFYSHNGYDMKRIIKASLVNLTTQNKSQGASTISQQLIKNALLTNEKTYSRKIKEIVLSMKMEKMFSKDEILEMYLNTIYFGSNAYGIENASKTYFNKSSKDLTLNEACLLAGIIKSPNYYSPRTNYDNAVARKNLVASIMYDNNFITKEEYDLVLSTPLNIQNMRNTDHSYEEESIYEACSILNISERELINRKYQILTYKDDTLQQNVISANNKIISENRNQNNTNIDSLSVVASNNGEVLAYYSNSNLDLHNLSRQPASTLKPLAVYLPCLMYDVLNPASMILDEEINYNGFSPKNADKTYRGYVSTRECVAYSLNIPAVKALEYVGLNKSRDTLSKLGININNSDMNLSLSLGALKNGVSIMELLSAYTILANMGTYRPLTFIDKILDENGNIIYSNEDYSKQVVDEESTFLLTDMLKDTSKYGTAKRLSSLNMPIACKTGTASQGDKNTDLYNIAYTSQHTMITWIGDLLNESLPSNMHSSTQPTEINKQILSKLYTSPPADFTVPAGIIRSAYDLSERETNNILVSPTTTLDRYIAYDYFKSTNTPKIVNNIDNANMNLIVDKTGVSIRFNTKKNHIYNVYREDKNKKILLKQIKDSYSTIEIKDRDIFNQDEIRYFIEDENNQIISNIEKIRPKDYIVNQINNNILINKKKWYV